MRALIAGLGLAVNNIYAKNTKFILRFLLKCPERSDEGRHADTTRLIDGNSHTSFLPSQCPETRHLGIPRLFSQPLADHLVLYRRDSPNRDCAWFYAVWRIATDMTGKITVHSKYCVVVFQKA